MNLKLNRQSAGSQVRVIKLSAVGEGRIEEFESLFELV